MKLEREKHHILICIYMTSRKMALMKLSVVTEMPTENRLVDILEEGRAWDDLGEER